MNRKKIIPLLSTGFMLAFFCITQKAQAQIETIYRTINGNMIVTTVWNDSAFTLKTDKILVLLNYETAEFTIKIDPTTLHSGIDSLDERLAEMRGKVIEYTGRFGIDYINTKSHPPLDFEVEGMLKPGDTQIKGKGHLEHLYEGTDYACLLDMHFYLNIADTGLNLNIKGLGDDAYISIVQTVLRRITD